MTDSEPLQDMRGAVPSTAAGGLLSYLLLRAAKAHKAYAALLLRRIGLYPGQELMLMQLWDRNGQTQAELGRSLQLDPSTITRMARRLEDQGFVSRSPSTTDRRVVVVSLTARGHELRQDVGRIWVEIEQVTIAGLPERSQHGLLSGLVSMTTAINEAVETTAAEPRR